MDDIAGLIVLGILLGFMGGGGSKKQEKEPGTFLGVPILAWLVWLSMTVAMIILLYTL